MIDDDSFIFFEPPPPPPLTLSTSTTTTTITTISDLNIFEFNIYKEQNFGANPHHLGVVYCNTEKLSFS